MLVLLLPSQISDKWNAIKYAISEAIPPTASESPEVMNNILMSLLNGSSQCWASYQDNGTVKSVDAILVTTIIEDFVSGTKTLQIYSLYGTKPIDDVSWIEGLATLKKYAKANNCIKVTAYSNVERIEEVVEFLGGEVEWKFISFAV